MCWASPVSHPCQKTHCAQMHTGVVIACQASEHTHMPIVPSGIRFAITCFSSLLPLAMNAPPPLQFDNR